VKLGQCVVCMQGTYTVTPMAPLCKDCIKNARCPGGLQLDVEAGFWRLNELSDTLIECLLPTACLGGTNSTDPHSAVECLEGYGGRLCHSCVMNEHLRFTRTGKHECIKCADPTINSLRILGLLILLIGYLLLLIL
jgi:hypothetical protein